MKFLIRFHYIVVLKLLLLWTMFAVNGVIGEDPPRITSIHENVDVVEGRALSLNCQASGSYPVEYKWARNGADITSYSTSGAYSVRSTTRSDAGTYRCTAQNAFGASLSPNANITIIYLNSFINDGIRRVNSSVGGFLRLSPPPLDAAPLHSIKFKWFFGENAVYSNQSHYVSKWGDLVVVGVEQSMSGRYRVEASSTLLPGRSVASPDYLISVSGINSFLDGDPQIVLPPRNQEFTQSERISGAQENIFVECVAHSRDLSSVEMYWRVNGSTIAADGDRYDIEEYGRRLVIRNPDYRRQAGVYECEARRGIASSSPRQAWINIRQSPFISLPLAPITSSSVGKPVELRCQSQAFPPSNTIWYRNAQQLIDQSDFGGQQNGNYVIGRDGSLYIQSVRDNMEGIYQCQPTNEAGSAITTTWLKTSVSGPLIDIPPVNVSVAAGQDARLECRASGAPPPVISWIFNDPDEEVRNNGNYRLEPNGDLTIVNSQPILTGFYTCTASNKLGTSTAQAYLSIAGRTQIVVGPTDQSVVIGSNIQFPCQVSQEAGRGRFTRNWFFNGQLITAGSSRTMEIRNDGSLFIRQVGPSKIGTYECTVTSPFGTESIAGQLDIVEKPGMPLQVRAQLINQTLPAKVRVTWLQGFDGNSPIIKYLIQHRILGLRELWSDWERSGEEQPSVTGNGDGEREAIIDNLRPSSVYEFRVIAVNRFGSGKPSEPSNNITMPQQPPAAAPRNVAGSARSASSIMIQWQPPPPDQWNGDILGYNVRYRLANYPHIPWIKVNLTQPRARNVLLEDLITWREYEIQVSAYNERGMGVYSKSQYITTQEGVPNEAPTNVNVTVLNSTAVYVEFTPPPQQMIPGVNLGYKIEAWRGPVGDGELAVQALVLPYSTSRVEKVVNGLRKYTQYNVTTLCYTAPGNGPRSAPILVTTKQDVPGPVQNMRFADVLFSSVRVVWDPPLDPNGMLTNYTLDFWVSNQSDTTRQTFMVLPNRTEQKIEGLSPSTHYTFQLYAFTAKGRGPASTSTMESGVPPELPGAPSSLIVSNVQSRSVSLQFSPGYDGKTIITQWVVEGQVGAATAWSLVYNTSEPNARTITVRNLRPYTQYRLRLVAENVVGRSPPSGASETFSTLQAPPNAPPSHLSAEPVSSTSVSITWTPLPSHAWNGIPKGYVIYYRKNEEKTRELQSLSPALFIDDNEPFNEREVNEEKANEYRLENLDPFTVYDIAIQARNQLDSSEITQHLTAKTYEGVPSGAPQNVHVTSESSKSVRVQWESVPRSQWNGRVLGYRVFYNREEGGVTERKEMEISGESRREVLLNDLRSYSQYSISVAAFTVVGLGPQNNPPKRMQTLEDLPGPPSEVKFQYVSLDRVRIAWNQPYQPNGLIKRYEIAHWPNNSNPETAVKSQVGRELHTFSASGLQSQTIYAFTVTGETSIGWGEPAKVYVYTTTTNVPPPAPTTPTLDTRLERSANSLGITWRIVETYSAPIRLIDVQYQEASKGEWIMWTERIPATSKNTVIHGLLPNRAYRFRVKCENDHGQSGWSPDSDWMKTLNSHPSEPPNGIGAVPYDSTAIKITWKPPSKLSWNSDFVGFRVLYKDYDAANTTINTQELPRNTQSEETKHFVLKGLQRFRHYMVQVQTFNEQGSSPLSVPVFVYVGFSVPRKGVTGLKATVVSSTQIDVTWNHWSETNEPITGFKVIYGMEDEPTSSWREDIAKNHESRVELGDLLKFKTYQIHVLPFNKAGEGPVQKINGTTLEDSPGPVGNLVFSDILLDSLNVSWAPPNEPNGIILGYKVQYETYKVEIEYVKKIQEKVTRTYLRAANLETNVTYTFWVSAETKKGYGPTVTGKVTIGPQPGSPEPPKNLRAYPSDSHVTLEWDNQNSGRGPITGYIIQVQRLQKSASTTNNNQILTPPGQIRTQTPTSSTGPTQTRQLRTKRQANGPNHPQGEWVVIGSVGNSRSRHSLSYEELEKASVYRFRVFARNSYGVSFPSPPSKEIIVPEEVEEPFYLKWWFLVILALVSLVIIVIVVALLCVTGRNNKFKYEKRNSVDSLRLADGGIVTYELRQSQRNAKQRRVPLSGGEAISGWQQGTIGTGGGLSSRHDYGVTMDSHHGGVAGVAGSRIHSRLDAPPPLYSNVLRGGNNGTVNNNRIGPTGALYDSLAVGTGPVHASSSLAQGGGNTSRATTSHHHHGGTPSLYTEKTDIEDDESGSSGSGESGSGGSRTGSEEEDDKDMSSIVQHYQTSDVAYRETWRRAKEGAAVGHHQQQQHNHNHHHHNNHRPPSLSSAQSEAINSVASHQPAPSTLRGGVKNNVNHPSHNHPPPHTPGSRAPIPGFSSFV